MADETPVLVFYIENTQPYNVIDITEVTIPFYVEITDLAHDSDLIEIEDLPIPAVACYIENSKVFNITMDSSGRDGKDGLPGKDGIGVPGKDGNSFSFEDLTSEQKALLLQPATTQINNLWASITSLQQLFANTVLNDWFYLDENGNIGTNYNFYSTKEISAYGIGTDTGETPGTGGATNLNDLVDVVIDDLTLANNQTLVYDTSVEGGRWVNKTIESFAPTSHTHGNITNLGAIGVDANLPIITGTNGVLITSSINDFKALLGLNDLYLSLTGGTMSNTNLVTNLNADLLDGKEGTYYTDYIDTKVASKLDTIIFNSHASNNDVNIKHLTDAQLNYLNNLISWWKIDTNGNLYTEKNLYSTLEVSAYGAGSSGSGGTSYSRLDSWLSYDSSKSGWVLSALLGKDLHDRVSVLEAGGGGIETEIDPTVEPHIKNITSDDIATWNSKLATSIFTAHADNQTTNVKHLTDAQLSSLTALTSYWKLDNDGNLYTEKNVYSTGEVSAFGAGSGGSTGGGLIQTVYDYSSLGGTFNNATLTDTFNAYTINEINNRLTAVELNNSYSLPTASASVLGGVKIGTNVTISNGVISVHNPLTININKANGLSLSTQELSLELATTSINGALSSTDKTYIELLKTFFEWDATNSAIKAKYNFYSTGEVSAYGYGASGGGGVGSLVTWGTESAGSVPLTVEGVTKTLSLASHTHTFASLTSKPTTLSGYGITDAYTKSQTDTAINNIQVGGRNLVRKGGELVINSDYPTKSYDLSETTKIGEIYTYQIKGELAEGQTSWLFYGNDWIPFGMAYVDEKYDSVRGIYYGTFTATRAINRISVFSYPEVAGDAKIEWVKLEKGNKATDWTPAPEDHISDWLTTDVNSFSYIKNKPTTLSGYGITDAYTKTYTDATYLKLTGGTLTGNLTAPTFIGALTGNAATATKLSSSRTFALTGDVTGTITSDLTSGFSIVTTIAPNSVALGTDTTGNYAGSVGVSGNGLTITGTAGEGTTFTVNSNATSLNTASTLVFRDASGNFSAGTITAQTDILTPFNTWSNATDKNSLKKFLNLFDIDTEGNLVVKTNLYSTGEVTAYSTGTGVSGLTLMGEMNANNYALYNLGDLTWKDGSNYIKLGNNPTNWNAQGNIGLFTNWDDSPPIASFDFNTEIFYYGGGNVIYDPSLSALIVPSLKSNEVKFGNWTFRQDTSGRLGIYNGTTEVACFNTDGTYINL